MPKVQGPLFSLAASGTVAKHLTFRTSPLDAIAQWKPVPTGKPSPAQLIERARVRLAAQLWMSLDLTDRQAWRDYAIARSKAPWIAFCNEYLIQQCDAENLPLIPAQPFTEL